MILKLPTLVVSALLLIISLAASAAAQQKRQTPARTQPHPAATPVPTPPPTFDTLIAADTFRVYGEVRSVGQLIKSPSVNEILEPILKLAGPPKEFRTLVKWLNTHADEVISSRMLVASWSSGKDLPEAVIAIEFASSEEATKFQQQLVGVLQKVIPPATPNAAGEPNKVEKVEPPPYHLQRTGSLIVITPRPFDLAKLRPAGSKLLSEDPNFLVARNRLNSESIFVFLDVSALEKEEAERDKKAEQEYQKSTAERAAKAQVTAPPKVELHTGPDESELPPVKQTNTEAETELIAPPPPAAGAEQQRSPLEVLMDLSMVMALTGTEGKWPAAIGFAISLEGESFDVRALMVTPPGEKSDPVPFLPMLAIGPAITPEAQNILPADTEMLVAMSLDVPQIYATLAEPRPMLTQFLRQSRVEEVGAPESPFAELERKLNIKIKDDVLPLIGSEIAVSLPMRGMAWFQPPKSEPPAVSQPSPAPASLPSPSPEPSPNPNQSATFTLTETTVDPLKERSTAIVISLKDKEGMRAFLPKLIESLAFKGASALAQTERREDTELVSYVNMVSYAFIGNFLVISPDVATTRHIVDSYLKRQTLSGEPHFKNYTRWQPRQVQGQIYISPSLMESYRTWIQQPNTPVDDQTRAFLTRFSVVAQPVTYTLSNEGFGPLHELHIPKNLVLLIIAGSVGGMTPPTQPGDMPPNPPPPIAPPPTRPSNPF